MRLKMINLIFSNGTQNTNSSIIPDLGLDSLQNILDKESFYNFIKVISNPLTSLDKIYERQNILKDFIDHENLAKNVYDLCKSHAEMRFPTYGAYSRPDTHSKLRDCLKTFNDAYSFFDKLLGLLKNNTFKSKNLNDLLEKLNENSSFYDEIRISVNKMAQACFENDYTLSVTFNEALVLQNGNISSTNYWQSKFSFFKKKSAFFAAVTYANDQMAENCVYEINDKISRNLISVTKTIIRLINDFCDELTVGTGFYLSAIKILKKAKCFCFPVFDSDFIIAESIYDISINGDIVYNNFESETGYFYLISGPNQGGKTTFLRSLGTAQLFAQGGIIVPAERYRCPVYQNIITHFPKDEDADCVFGKLAEELTRLKTDYPKMSDNALVLFNESFATTTEKEGCEIAEDILKALSTSDSDVFFVTHIYKLLEKYKEIDLLNNKKVKSLVSGLNKDLSRNYKIYESEPQKQIYTMEFLF